MSELSGNKGSPRRRSFPSEAELLLLRAAIQPPALARDAWAVWLSTNDLDGSTPTDFEFFPAIYRNLEDELGQEEGRLKGVYRQTWLRNQRLFTQARRAVALLEGEGIPAILLKGAALTAGTYEDGGARPMVDVDLMVPLAQAERALQLLATLGWQPEIANTGSMTHTLQVVRSIDLMNGDKLRLDLHWHLLADECDPEDDADFWRHAVPLSWMGLTTRKLAAADQLLHSIYHGQKWSQRRTLVWWMDAYRVIEAAGAEMDWPRLVAATEKAGAVLPVLSALRYLHDEMGASVPPETIQQLSRGRTGWLDRLNYRSQDTQDDLRGVVLREVFGYLKRMEGRPLGTRLVAWYWYLQAAWGLSSPLQLFPILAARVYRRLRFPRPVGQSGADHPQPAS